ncbi:hypothetical protein NL676_004045 [Syzygium grande]|nr:hypothetical protein NL676_004045 [Syzygium grande]
MWRYLPFRDWPDECFVAEVQATANTFRTFFRVTTVGESHGGGVGCIFDGCPPRMPLLEAEIQADLDRRGVTTGTPILISVAKTDQRGHDYNKMSIAYRPSHADATYDMKYGV